MKIAALLMVFAGSLFLWTAFRTYFFKRRPLLLNLAASPGDRGGRFSGFSAYYLACAAAAIYFATLFYSGSKASFIVMPAICASLSLWRRNLLRRA
ncbi:hypothetical protein [Janthinobacterium sp. RB2R34]|uniref:hypothetical protein n=1 Tax=Janthinobacterium sp. RB2R34 TaxID=3424193 RepID=UPI003F28040B